MSDTHPSSIATRHQRTYWLALRLATLLALIALLPVAPSAARPGFAPRPVAAAHVPAGPVDGSHRISGVPMAAADGTGFALSRLIGNGNSTASVAMGDLNGDGTLDIVFGNDSQTSQVLLNDGHGDFNKPIDLPGSGRPTQSVAVGDLNGDGALDIVLGNDGLASQVYLNKKDGSGGFAAPSDLSLPIDGARATQSVALGDLNGDGAFDIVLGNVGYANGQFIPQSSLVYLNDGHGDFKLPTLLNPAGDTTRSVALGDLDGDGALDIVLGNTGSYSSTAGFITQPSQVYLNKNDRSGSFKPPTDIISSGLTLTSVAVGDLDGDGALDLVLGNAMYEGNNGFYDFRFPASQVYLNKNNPRGDFKIPPIELSGSGNTRSVGLGDLDGDGALDLILGRVGYDGNDGFVPLPSKVYLNDRVGGFAAPIELPNTGRSTNSVAVADLNGDGALDFVLGNADQPSEMYLNGGESSLASPTNLPIFYTGDLPATSQNIVAGDLNGDGALDLVLHYVTGETVIFLNKNDGSGNFDPQYHYLFYDLGAKNIAVGDLNGDGALDLVFGNSDGSSYVYLNNGQSTFNISNSLPSSGRSTQSVALGDLNGDGALDIVLGNASQPSQVYRNDGHGGFASPADLPDSISSTRSVALGDLNGDGALDIVLGKGEQLSQVYLNDGHGGFAAPNELPDSGRATQSVAVGDLNGDGALDLILSNDQPSQVYINKNDGHGGFAAPAYLPDSGGFTQRVVLGDLNGDGAFDLILDSQVYLNKNDGSGNFTNPSYLPASGDATQSIAVGDLNSDGALDLVFENQVFLNRRVGLPRLPNNPPAVAVVRPGTPDANFYSTPKILDSATIPISYTLFDHEGDTVRAISATFSLDGGGSWRPAKGVSVPIDSTNVMTDNLKTSAAGEHYLYKWDTFASNVFGQPDNVVFRIVAYPGAKPIANGVPGPYQRPYVAATTFPFRVRGTQVFVPPLAAPAAAPDTLTHKLFLPLATAQAPGALPAIALNETGALVYRIQPNHVGVPLADAAGQPFRTDARGYLRGRGEVAPGDQLVALQPIAATSAYTVYLTNATPTATGLDSDIVKTSGVQTLTVSTANSLVLFNLTIALEWDARNDTKFLSDLSFDLQRTSELLYDWTNGQAALGDITVYHAKAHWDDANIRLNASNRLRPSANQGGIAEPLNQIRIGAVWNRFGDSGGNQGEDWPRALAHELGHYAFNLDDNYLGLDSAGKLISVSGCPGAMSDPYRDDYSEFHPRADWLKDCSDTLANRTSGQSDWETIARVYPWLHAPDVAFKQVNPGPSRLPLAVTQIHFVAPPEQAATLATPVFNLTRAEDGGRLLPGDRARAFLFKRSAGAVADLIDLGRPALDQVAARGAVAGDRLCVYDAEATRLGCKDLAAGDTQLALGIRTDWQPQLIVTPVTSRTLTLTVPAAGVGKPAPLVLLALVFPSDVRSAPSGATLTLQNGVYQGSITLTATSLEGYVQIEVPEDGAFGRAIVTDYALGGNPAPPRRPRRRTRRRAPAMSTDGQVIMYGKNLDFANGEFYAIQTATALPAPPAWATFVGQGYRLIASPNAPALAGVALNVSYADGDVAAGTANGVSLYRWDGATWQLLPGLERGIAGEVTAPISQAGLYVLMSSAEIELKAGINLVAYPIAGERPVREALASIEGSYTTVRSYNPATDSWLIYTAGAPEYANTLQGLEYGKGYELRVTHDVTLLLRGEDTPPATALARIAPPQAFPPAPARYYGVVGGGVGLGVAAGQVVRATIDGHICGAGQTQRVAGQLVYTVDVAADATLAGCGAPGRRVTITLEGRGLAKDVGWDNQQARELNLGG